MVDLSEYYRCCFAEDSCCEDLENLEWIIRREQILEQFRKRLKRKTKSDFEVSTPKVSVVFHTTAKGSRRCFFTRSGYCSVRMQFILASVLIQSLEEELLRISEFTEDRLKISIYLRKKKVRIEEFHYYRETRYAVALLISSPGIRKFDVELYSRNLKRVKTVFSEDAIMKIKKFLAVR